MDTSDGVDPPAMTASAGPIGRVEAARAWLRLSPPLAIFVWSRLVIWAAAAYAWLWFLPRPPANPPNAQDLGYLTDVWAHWDAGWFLGIANSGYSSATNGQPSAAAPAPTAPSSLACAATLFLRRKTEPDTRLLHGWLAPALVAAAFAAAAFTLFPTLYSDWVDAGDILQLASLALLTLGVIAEMRAATRRMVDLAVLEERRRLARELHDGIAQELAFITAALSNPAELTPEGIATLRSAGERALHESRRAIAALSLRQDTPLGTALAAELEDIARRFGAKLDLTVDAPGDVDPRLREPILRVAREAALNAVRHGGATSLKVELAAGSQRSLCLTITDDGSGFDVDDALAARAGFGLTAMCERVDATHGRLQIESTPGDTTRVEARWDA